MWKKTTLTTADNTENVSFKGRGSIYAEGTFGGGSVELHVISYANNEPNAAKSVATGFLDSAIDGTTIKTIDCPAGDYQLDLSGSTSASVDVYYNDQVQLVTNS